MIALNLLPTCDISILQLVLYEGIHRLCEWFYCSIYDIDTVGKCIPRFKQLSYKTDFYILFGGCESI